MAEKLKKSRLVKSMKWGIIAGLVITIISFLISIVPCIKSGEFGVCSLPNPFVNLGDLGNVYYGISNNPMAGLILQFIIPVVIVFLIINVSRRKTTDKVVDYTKK